MDLIHNKNEILLVGDLNSKTPVVGCNSLDTSGRILNDILNDSELTVLNNHFPTYFKFGSNYEEILDLMLGSITLCNRFVRFGSHSAYLF